MAGSDRETAGRVAFFAALADHPYEFDFYQALPRLYVTFGGMFGPQGPLPLHLTEYARDRIINSADPTFARFLDIFHHRMLSLVYRAWADAQPTVQFDRPESDRF